MQTILIIAAAVFIAGAMLLFFFGREPHLTERVTVGAGHKGQAFTANSALLEIERDAGGTLRALVYSGFTRNPGSSESVGVVRRWEPAREQPGKWLTGVVWEHEVREIHELPWVRINNTLCAVDYDQTLRAFDVTSGETQWQTPLPSSPAAPLTMSDDGYLTVQLDDATWLRVDPRDGSEAASGRMEQPSGAGGVVELGAFALERVDARRAIMDGVTMELENADLADDGVDSPGNAVLVSQADEVPDDGRVFARTARPPTGRHVLELSGRALLPGAFAVADDMLVVLSGAANGDAVELFADVVALDDFRVRGSVRLGAGGADSRIEFANAVGDELAIRVSGVRPWPEASAQAHVTYLLAPRLAQIRAIFSAADQSSRLFSADGSVLWSGSI